MVGILTRVSHSWGGGDVGRMDEGKLIRIYCMKKYFK